MQYTLRNIIMCDSKSVEEYSRDEDCYGSKFMPIELPKNFDPNKVPTTGEEYLYHVMYEAKRCATIATGNISGRKINQPSILLPLMEDCVDAPKSMIPTQQWQKEKIEDFTRLRKYVNSRLPKLCDVDKCDHTYWIKEMDKEYPKFSVVSSFNSRAHFVLLEKITNKLELIKTGDTITNTMGCWIYSILSVLQTPLPPNIFSALRSLARQCARVRSRLSSDAPLTMYQNLNLIICIISRYFGQYDLADGI